MRHRSEDAKEQTRRDGARAATGMHEEAVQPLKSEVLRMRQALVNLQGTYTQDIDQVRPQYTPPQAPGRKMGCQQTCQEAGAGWMFRYAQDKDGDPALDSMCNCV